MTDRLEDAIAEVLQAVDEGRLRAAAQACLALQARHPGVADLPLLMGTIRMIEGDFAAAADCFGQVLRIDPTNVAAHRNLAVAFASQGRSAQAEAAFRAGLAVDPASAELLYDFGAFLLASERPREAIEIGRAHV